MLALVRGPRGGTMQRMSPGRSGLVTWSGTAQARGPRDDAHLGRRPRLRRTAPLVAASRPGSSLALEAVRSFQRRASNQVVRPARRGLWAARGAR